MLKLDNQSLNCSFIYKGTLVAFNNGVEMILLAEAVLIATSQFLFFIANPASISFSIVVRRWHGVWDCTSVQEWPQELEQTIRKHFTI